MQQVFESQPLYIMPKRGLYDRDNRRFERRDDQGNTAFRDEVTGTRGRLDVAQRMAQGFPDTRLVIAHMGRYLAKDAALVDQFSVSRTVAARR